MEFKRSDKTTIAKRTHRLGGITETFPMKLHNMLKEVSQIEIYSDIIRWNEHGNTILILRPKDFTRLLLPKYFRTQKLASCQRQLNAYGFVRGNLYAGQDDIHIYYHDLFRRDHPEKVELIKRKGSISPSPKRTANMENAQLQALKMNALSRKCIEINNAGKNDQISLKDVTQTSEVADGFHSHCLHDTLDTLSQNIGQKMDEHVFYHPNFALSDWNAEIETLKSESENDESK